jgi:hypothetical protein
MAERSAVLPNISQPTSNSPFCHGYSSSHPASAIGSGENGGVAGEFRADKAGEAP